jgi:hypothetical protein
MGAPGLAFETWDWSRCLSSLPVVPDPLHFPTCIATPPTIVRDGMFTPVISW